MSRNKFFLSPAFLLFSFMCHAQVSGSDTVCAGYIYTYNANIPGAATYIWTVPATWYGLSGQGTSQINVTCNNGAGQVCTEGFDSIGNSLGLQCLTTNMGIPAGGGGNWHLEPSGFNGVCDNVWIVNITPTVVYNGGGGGCLGGCGTSAIPHPNIVFALYSGNIFQGEIGTNMNLGLGTYYAAYVDTTMGPNFPQAVQITGGICGGSVSGIFSIGQIGLIATVSQTPFPVCIGDTVYLQGNGMTGGWGGPYWNNLVDLIPVTSVYNFSQLWAIVTGPSPSVLYNIYYVIQTGIFSGGTCSANTIQTLNVVNCNASASLQASNTSICENSCINFLNNSANATSYQWFFPGANPSASTDVNPSNICYSVAGSYDVTLIASNSGHVDTLVLPGYITVNPWPQAAFSAIDTEFCTPGCVGFINASLNATSYLWSFQGGNPTSSTSINPQSICYNTSGNFTVSLICSNSGCSDSLTLTNNIHALVSPQSSMGANPISFCPGGCTDFSNFSTNATSYEWNFPGATIDTSTAVDPSSICYNLPGTYGVQLICSNVYCTDTLNVSNYINIYPQPAAISIADIGDTLQTDQGFASYQWYLNGNIIPSATEYFYVAYAAGDYNIVATDSNGCEVEAALYNVMVNLKSISSENGFSVVPNPFTNKFILHPYQASPEKIAIVITNSLGEKLFERHTSFIEQEIDLSSIDAGLYIITISSDHGTFQKKIMKM